MKSPLLIFLLVAIVVLLAPPSEAKRVSGDESGRWEFLSMFCFSDAGQGTLSWKMTTKDVDVMLCFYDDESSSWDDVYHSSLSCQEKVDRAKPLHSSANVTGDTCYTVKADSDNVEGFINFSDKQRPHYWYVVAANCEEVFDIDHFNLHFTNPGNSWKREFSYDDQSLLELYVIFFIFFVALMCLQLNAFIQLYRGPGVHPVVKLLTIALALETVSIFCYLIHYTTYAGDGEGSAFMHFFAVAFDVISTLIFMLMLIVIACGWTITHQHLDSPKQILAVMGAFSFFYIIMYIVEAATRDPASTSFIYSNVIGVIIIIMRLGTMVWFLWCLKMSYSHEEQPEKKKLYKFFGGIMTFWFLTLPFICIIAAALDAWVRHKVVEWFYTVFTFFAYGIMVYLFWPSRAGVYFAIAPKDMLSSSLPYDQI